MTSSLQLALGMTLFSAISCLIVASMTADRGTEAAVMASALIATGNGVCALLLTHLGSKRGSTKAFFGAVFGGMALRLGTTLTGLLVGVKVFLLPALPFATALLAFTGIFMAAELTHWSRLNFSPRAQHS